MFCTNVGTMTAGWNYRTMSALMWVIVEAYTRHDKIIDIVYQLFCLQDLQHEHKQEQADLTLSNAFVQMHIVFVEIFIVANTC